MTRFKTFTRDQATTLGGYRENPETFAGNFATKLTGPVGVELLELSDFDERYYADVELKDNERLFRMTSDTMRISGQKPLVKINVERGLVYYMDRDEDPVTFESRGVKATFLNLVI